MIQVKDLDKSYGSQVVFDKVSFTVNACERIGLVGRNGHGKTTLFRILLGMEHPDAGTVTMPDNYKTGHLDQHIEFTMGRVLDEACLSLFSDENDGDKSYKAETVLLGLGFSSDDFNRNPMDLSGGFQVRLNLAKALLSDPNLLLLDEPTNYLDIVSLRWLVRFLRNWKNELIIITHDRDFMDSVTTHTMAIHRCKIKKEAGTTEKVYNRLLLEEEIYEKTRINDEKKRKEAERFINRFRAKATKARAVQSRIKALQKREQLDKLSEIRNLEFTFNAAPFTGKQLMEVRELSFGFDRSCPLLIDGLSFFVGKKDRIGIIGRNGKGKTTLLNLLAGELTPLGGSVTSHKYLKAACFGQTNIIRLNQDSTVEEEILNAHPYRDMRSARGICGAMMFPGDIALKKIRYLSGGEKSRVLLGKLLVSPANLLLLDEPTNHLDMESTESLLDAVSVFDGAVIIVTHSEMILRSFAERLIVFDGGKVTLFEGSYEDFLERTGWKEERGDNKAGLCKGVVVDRVNNKKQQRRIRAEVIKEKSKVLGELRAKMERIETEIVELEEKSEQNNHDLLEASLKGDGETIKQTSKAIHDARLRIETLFSELESVHNELDRKTREFDEQLGE